MERTNWAMGRKEEGKIPEMRAPNILVTVVKLTELSTCPIYQQGEMGCPGLLSYLKSVIHTAVTNPVAGNTDLQIPSRRRVQRIRKQQSHTVTALTIGQSKNSTPVFA